MTIGTTTRVAGPFIGDGAAVNLDFTYKVFEDTDVQVISRLDSTGVDTTLTLGSDYTVTLNVDQDAAPGGRVTLLSALAVGRTAFVVSQVNPLQETAFTNSGGFYPTVLNDSLDRLHALHLENREVNSRAVLTPVGETGNLDLPPVANRAGKFLYFDGSGNITAATGTADGPLRDELLDDTAGGGTDLVYFVDPVAPAYLKTLSDILSGLPVNFFRFVTRAQQDELRARTNTDDLAANLAAALASGVLDLHFEPGLYNFDTAIHMSVANQRLKGAGSPRCQLNIRSTTAQAIKLANGVAGYGLSGFKITRTGTPGAAALGVEFLGTTDNTTLEDLLIEGHYTNLKLGTCDTGYIRKVTSRLALAYGVTQTNSAAYGPSQWDVDGVLVERNTVDGWLAQSTDGPDGMILGAMRNFRSFANGGRALHVIGSNTTPVYDLRLSDAFIGSDALGGVRLDTYGGKHRVSGFFERIGRDNVGPGLTPPSGYGPGIDMTANNTDLVVHGSTIDDNSYDGINHAGGVLTVGTSHIFNNGAAGTVGRRNGILSSGGRLIVGVDMAGGMPSKSGGAAGTSQLYGVATSHDDYIIVGLDGKDNATAATTLGATTDGVVLGVGADGGTTIYRFPNPVRAVRLNSANGAGAGRGTNGACTMAAASNITSVTRSATGTYDVLFANQLPTGGYTVLVNASAGVMVDANLTGVKATTGFSFIVANSTTGTALDPTAFEIIVEHP